MVHLRVGPGQEYPVSWIISKQNLPVYLISEFGQWRKIKMHDDTQGWVHQNMISRKGTAIVIAQPHAILYKSSEKDYPIAKIEKNVIVKVLKVDGDVIKVEVNRIKGWLQIKDLWGVKDSNIVDDQPLKDDIKHENEIHKVSAVNSLSRSHLSHDKLDSNKPNFENRAPSNSDKKQREIVPSKSNSRRTCENECALTDEESSSSNEQTCTVRAKKLRRICAIANDVKMHKKNGQLKKQKRKTKKQKSRTAKSKNIPKADDISFDSHD